MSIGEPICAFYGFIKAERPRIFAEVAQREGLNTELFDFADELVVRGPSGEVERFVDALRKAIMMRMGEINAMHERDLLTHRTWKAEWEVRWMVKIVLDEPRDMERVEVFVRDLFRKNVLADAFTEARGLRKADAFTEARGLRKADAFIINEEEIGEMLEFAKVAERVPEVTPPPVAAQDATDATESSTECPPPAETCSVRCLGRQSRSGSRTTSRAGVQPLRRVLRGSPLGIPLPGRADVKTSNRARSKPRPKRRPRSSTESGHAPLERPRDEPVLEETRRRDDRASPEGNERAVGYEPVADGADGDAAVAEDHRDRAPAAEATRREDVGDAAEPRTTAMRRKPTGKPTERKAQLDTELEREKRGRVRVPATGPPPAPRAVGESADESAPRPRPPASLRRQQTNIENIC